MHSIWTRMNTLFFNGVVALGIMAGLATLSTYWENSNPTLNVLKLNTMERFMKYSDGSDKAILSFDLKSELRSEYNWNVKQIFAYVSAEYTSLSNEKNQIIIWDSIHPNKGPFDGKLSMKAKRNKKKGIYFGNIKVKNEKVNYFLADMYDELRSAKVNLTLHWDIMPNCGRLYQKQIQGTGFDMPTVYMKGKKKY